MAPYKKVCKIVQNKASFFMNSSLCLQQCYLCDLITMATFSQELHHHIFQVCYYVLCLWFLYLLIFSIRGLNLHITVLTIRRIFQECNPMNGEGYLYMQYNFQMCILYSHSAYHTLYCNFLNAAGKICHIYLTLRLEACPVIFIEK